MKIKIKTSKEGAALKKLIGDINKNKKVSKAGWFEKEKYEDGTQIAYVAAVQEFGDPAKKIPPRPYMRPTIKQKKIEWENIIAQLFKQSLNGDGDIDKILASIGLRAAGDIRETITKLQDPPLKQSTINARLNKKSDKKTIGNLYKPLVDSGVMLNTLTNVVEEK